MLHIHLKFVRPFISPENLINEQKIVLWSMKRLWSFPKNIFDTNIRSIYCEATVQTTFLEYIYRTVGTQKMFDYGIRNIWVACVKCIGVIGITSTAYRAKNRNHKKSIISVELICKADSSLLSVDICIDCVVIMSQEPRHTRIYWWMILDDDIFIDRIRNELNDVKCALRELGLFSR